ncbi:NAD-dependent epimerase/dehydratase family protein [Candidatus Micrarchaeota archaeon]|nr:NAD-dependent epimerase/dehydratase family protein [Candidatus Micrarchaeota archaeon]
MKVAVTGGAGFIGSHLVDKLIEEGHIVVVIDNLLSGKEENINKEAVFVRKDIRHNLSKDLEGVEAVFHLAADPDVRASAEAPRTSFDLNVEGTFDLLESCRRADIEHILFASTSTVYGEAEAIPTPEDYPCMPISNYGASKLACEAYISAFSASYGFKGTSLRFANIFGERSTHGVMFDFFHKLNKSQNQLEILGDGNQDKSYLHVSDCVSAILAAWQHQDAQYDVFNVGSREKTTVKELAELMCRIMDISPEFKYTGTPRGWVGDVKVMLLDTSKLEKLGWKEEVSFEEGMKRYLRFLESRS